MKHIILLCFLLSATTVQAQTNLVGITAGPTHTSASGARMPSGKDSYTAGITFQHFFLRRFSLGADLMYSSRGYSDNIPTVSNSGRSRSSKTVTLTYDYISLPLKAGIKFGRKVYFFINGGLVPAVLLRAEVTGPFVDGRGNYLGTRIDNITSKTTRFDMGGLLEMGVAARLSKELRLSATLFYQSSFGSTTQEYDFSTTSVSHYGVGFLIGVKYKLPQRARASEEPETNLQ